MVPRLWQEDSQSYSSRFGFRVPKLATTQQNLKACLKYLAANSVRQCLPEAAAAAAKRQLPCYHSRIRERFRGQQLGPRGYRQSFAEVELATVATATAAADSRLQIGNWA